MTQETHSILRTSVHFGRDQTSSPSPTSSKTKPVLDTPTTAATIYLSTFAASLPSPTHQQLFLDHGKQIIIAYAKTRRQEALVTTLQEPGHIPRSARLAFTLNASKSVAETADFKAASDATTAAVDAFQTAATAQIIAVARLELTSVQTDTAHKIYTTICTIAKALVLLAGTPENATGSTIRKWVQSAVTPSPVNKLLQCCDITSRSKIFMDIVGMDMQQISAAANNVNMNDIDNNAAALSAFSVADDQSSNDFAIAVEHLIWGSFQAYLKKEFDLKALANANKFIQSTSLGTATDAAAMVIDSEPAVNAATLQSLIAAAVKKELQKSTGAGNSKKSAGSISKNNVRGAANRASLKNKSSSNGGANSTSSKPLVTATTTSTTTRGRTRNNSPAQQRQRNNNNNNNNNNTNATPSTTSQRRGVRNGAASSDAASTDASKRGGRDNTKRPLRKKSRSNSRSRG